MMEVNGNSESINIMLGVNLFLQRVLYLLKCDAFA